MAQVQLVKKPRRWDTPFGRERMRSDVVSELLTLPFWRDNDGNDFPDDLTLTDIIANDGRILRFNRGDIIYRRGAFDNSIYIILRGRVCSAASSDGEQAISRGLAYTHTNEPRRGDSLMQRLGHLVNTPKPTLRIQDFGALGTRNPADVIGPDGLFGECEALTRSARANTHFAEEDETLLLELRWPGAREIRHWSDNFRNLIDTLYRQRSQWAGLRNCALFAHLDDETIRLISAHCQFETHGAFDWTHSYQRNRAAEKSSTQIIEQEDIIAEQGHHLDDIMLIHSGFVRMSKAFERGEKTLGYVSKGDVIGLEEFKSSAGSDTPPRLQHSLRAAGYASLIRIPAHIAGEYLLDGVSPHSAKENPTAVNAPDAWLDFTLDNRFINGTQAMVINLDRCVNCDDCVRACAATHDNIPRFVRQGPKHQNLMIAHACMHCADPVCLNDCPTGAIHRDAKSGNVVINDATCIGCATCASACPYDNIRMEEVRNADGAFHIDEGGVHISRATKCDLCTGQRIRPACQQACPHNALIRIDIGDTRAVTKWLEYTQ